MKRINLPLYLLLVTAILFVSGCKKTDKSSTDTRSMPVNVAQVQTDSVTLTHTYPGVMTPMQMVSLVARVNGYLTGQYYKAGDHVKKGQLLFTIEDTQYQQAVKEAAAQLESAKSTFTYASNQYAALKKAFESDAVSQMEVIQGKSNMDNAEASIKQAEANLATARTNLGYCRVTAPFDGVMTAANPTVGDFLNGSASPQELAKIYDNSELHVNFSIEDVSYLRMFTNPNNRELINFSSVPINFDEPLPHEYTADLNYMSPAVNQSTGTLQLRGNVKNPYDELKAGMYVTVTMPYKVVSDAILVKDTSIGTDQQGNYVYTVNDSNKVVYTPIKTGQIVNDSMRVVESGLTPRSRYVTEALLKVRDGMSVDPVLVK